jgi:superfamily II DNA or RNA helicase
MSEELLAVIRKACPSALWSQGVKLAREGAVSSVVAEPNEITARVRERGRAVSPTVILYPADEEWDCDCGSKLSPCAHVVAAAIVVAQGGPLATPSADRDVEPSRGPSPAAASPAPRLAHIAYRFRVEHTALGLERVLVLPDGTERKLDMMLGDRVARGVREPPLEPTHDDLTVDRVMGRRLRGDVPFGEIPRVLAALSSATDVTLDGARVSTSGDVLGPEAIVRDGDRGGVELLVAPHRSITRVIAMGVGLAGDTLVPLGLTQEYGLRLERLPDRRLFPRERLGELVSELLPLLSKKMPVTVETKRLPKPSKALLPRIQMDLAIQGHTLFAQPLLVYGDPPVARIDAGRLTLLTKRGGPAPVRDEPRERALLTRLRDELSMVPGRRVSFEGREAARFVERLERFTADGHDPEEIRELSRELVPHLDVRGDDVELWFELADDDEDGEPGERRRASAAAVLLAKREGLGVVPLEGGGFARLPEGFLEKHGSKVADIVAAKAELERVPRTLLPVVAELADALGAPRPTSADKLTPLAQGFEGIREAPLPADLTVELRPYQRLGTSWLAFLRDAELGALLADDMGLGKTLQALAALSGRALVVCPKSVVHNWAAEIRRFRPSLTVSTYAGTKRSLEEADVTLTTYGLLRLDVGELSQRTWDVVILDEAQAIKNPDSQVARAAFRLDARFRIALSGTPVENRLDELWSLMRFANPGLLGSREHFDDRFTRPIENGDAKTAAALRARIRPFVLRRTKREVLPELPPRTESVMLCELEPDERAVYDAVRAATKKEVVEKLSQGGSVLAALEALLRLRQAACHSALVPGQSASTSSKVDRLTDALSELVSEGHRALVFSQWTSLLDKVEPHLEEAGIRYGRLDGSTRDRAAVVSEFQSESGPPVLLLSLKAGGVGLNLTAADHVFLLDPWWNPAAEDQAADRAHRIGQDKPVMIYRLVAKDTVEEGILALQEKKRRVADAALGEAGQAAAITRDDLLALLA